MFDDMDILSGTNTGAGEDFNLNLSADNFDAMVDAATKPAIPEGRQPASVTDFKPEYSKAGKPMFVWTFTVSEGAGVGKSFKHWTLLNSPQLPPLLKALGIHPTKTPHLFEGGGLRLNRESVVGRSVIVDVKWDKTLKEESATKPTEELGDDDYYTNAKARRFYEPAQ